MSSKQKLELTWIGKEKRPRLEPRILVEVPEKSYHAKEKKGDNDQFENMLIHGDNLLALKALEQDFTGKVKCIYIDPPYNTGSAFEHYDDGLEHSIWLGLMRERLVLLRNLLAEDGIIWVQLDDNESHYCKILMDEIFGRDNFVANIIWRKKSGGGQDAEFFAIEHENILVFKKKDWSIINETTEHVIKDFNRTINGKPAKLMKLEKWGTSAHRQDRPSLYYSIKDPNGNDFYPKAPDGQDGRWRKKPESLDNNHIYWEKRKDVWTPYEVIYFDEGGEKILKTRSIWLDFGNNTEATNEIKSLFGKKNFDTPKPENLIKKILEISTFSGDLVLDSFLGSGTTAAVAHKMGRRWIGIELGDHCYTHCIPRLQKVIDGTDQGGITKSANWQGGGGFRFFELGESLIQKDQWGQEIINKNFNAEMLAQALCKIEGFIYAPSKEEFFIHGHSTENDFIYVTTNFMTAEYLKSISEQLGEKRSLLICCKGFESSAEFSNLTVKKIPKAVLDKCEWGHDDYSLNVANLPKSASVPVQAELFDDIEGDKK